MLWTTRADEMGPWLHERQREILFQEAVLAFMGVDWNSEPDERPASAWPDQGLGARCRGGHVRECMQEFGNALELVCSTCATSYERTGRL